MKFAHLLLLIWLLLSAAGVSAQPAELAEKARKARELVVAGKSEEAIPLYQELLRASPNDPGMIMNLSIAQFTAKRYRDAIGQAEAALKLSPNLLSANLFLGASYLQLGEQARAVGPLQKVIEAQPNERNARLMLAEALLALLRHEEAAEHFQKASELAPENPRVWYGLGQSLEALSQSTLQQLEKAGPQSAHWFALAADASLKQRRYGRALEHYRQALDKQQGLRGAHAGLAAVYRQTGHSDWATMEEESERKIPAPDCTLRKLECEFIAGRYRAVIEAATGEKAPEALYWASKAHEELAREAYDRLAQLPPSVESYLHAAKTYDSQGFYLEAVKECRQALKLSPDNAQIETALAWSLYRRRDYEAALALLEGLLKRQPHPAELNFLYAASLVNMEQPEKAIPYLEEAIRRDPQFLPARAALGQAYLRAGKAEQSIPHLTIALPADEDGSGHFQLLRAYQITGQTELAKQALLEYQAFRKSAEEKKRLEEGYQITRP